MPSEYLKPQQVADRYGVARRKVYEWIHAHAIKAINIAHGKGRATWRVPVGALGEFDRIRQNVDERAHRRRGRAAEDVLEFIR